MRVLIIFATVVIFIACKRESVNELEKAESEEEAIKSNDWADLPFNDQLEAIKETTTKDSVLSNDIQFINDSILKGRFTLDISKYEVQNADKKCHPVRLKKETVYEFYDQGFNNVGDLNGDKNTDSVFVLSALSYCESGDSYYFTDNKIPRIPTESNCCHPKSIFSIGDIDDDGGNEIAEYFSSCASNFKSINIWTLKANRWNLVRKIGFFYNNRKYEAFKDFHKMYKKITKGKFKFLEISDMKANGEAVMEWRTISME